MNHPSPLAAVAGGLRLGGSTTFLLNLGRAFKDRGLTLPVVCMAEDHEMAADFESAGIPVHVLNQRALIFEDRVRDTYGEIAGRRPHAVLACLGSESFEVLRVLPKGVVRLGIIQSDDPLPYEMARNYAHSLDAIVGVSQKICDRLSEDAHYGGTRISNIPYGIHFSPSILRQRTESNAPLKLIYVGRMIETQKRVSRFVELIKVLTDRKLKFEFTFAGDGPELGSLRAALGAFTNVKFLGDVPNAEVPAVLNNHDVFLLLSDFEGLPLSLLEAMGQGLVPVVSDLESGMREAVIPKAGMTIPKGDLNAAADAICSLTRDRQRLADLSSAASQHVRENFSAARMAERYLSLVNDLTKSPPDWTARTKIPAPLIVTNAWMYRGLPRIVRRILKSASSRRAKRRN